MAELPDLAGSRLGTSTGHEVSQQRIQTFADATEDQQWIHVDASRASTGPFGGTIAHGYLTLSLATVLLGEVLEVTDSIQVINYGLDKVRFPSPVPSGAAVQMAVDLVRVEEFKGGLALHMVWTFQVPGSPKPVCVAEAIFRYYGVPDIGNDRVETLAEQSTGR